MVLVVSFGPSHAASLFYFSALTPPPDVISGIVKVQPAVLVVMYLLSRMMGSFGARVRDEEGGEVVSFAFSHDLCSCPKLNPASVCTHTLARTQEGGPLTTCVPHLSRTTGYRHRNGHRHRQS